jgi:hypothetical protein
MKELKLWMVVRVRHPVNNAGGNNRRFAELIPTSSTPPSRSGQHELWDYSLFELLAPTVVSVLRAQPLKYPAKHLTVRNNTKLDVCSFDTCVCKLDTCVCVCVCVCVCAAPRQAGGRSENNTMRGPIKRHSVTHTVPTGISNGKHDKANMYQLCPQITALTV